MIWRLVVAVLVAVVTAELIRPIGLRHKWPPLVAFGVSFLGGAIVALVVYAVVFGWS